MDFIETEQMLRDLSSKVSELAHTYREVRHKYGRAKSELFVLLVPRQNDPKYAKAALEKQFMMMIDDADEGQKEALTNMYKDYIILEQEYKGLEKLIEAYESRISSLQSLMKWQRENT